MYQSDIQQSQDHSDRAQYDVANLSHEAALNTQSSHKDPEQWQTSKYRLRKVMNDSDIYLSISNRFKSLVVEKTSDDNNDSNIEAAEASKTENDSNPTIMRTKRPSNQRRPDIVINRFPGREQKLRKSPKLIPGYSKYNKAHVRDTLILTDSMERGPSKVI